MRDQFIQRLFTMAKADPRLFLITGDLGFGVLEKFEDALPDQYLNIGVAEQNMIGVATGLALESRIVFTYSIGNFGTFRCFEQIRNDACYHNADVKVVCVGTGFSYGSLGVSHHATEDIGVFRSLPNITICSPGDLWEAAECTQAIISTPGTCYLRLDKSHAGNTQKPGEVFELGKARLLRQGSDVGLVTTGGILDEVLAAADTLAAEGIACSVLHYHTIAPFDSTALIQLTQSVDALITVEEHTISAGFGSLVAETLMDHQIYPTNFYRIGLRAGFSSVVGSQKFLRNHYKIDAPAIANQARQMVVSLTSKSR